MSHLGLRTPEQCLICHILAKEIFSNIGQKWEFELFKPTHLEKIPLNLSVQLNSQKIILAL